MSHRYWFFTKPADLQGVPPSDTEGENSGMPAEKMSSQDDGPSSFDDIVTRFGDLTNEVIRLQKESVEQQNQIKQYLSELQKSRDHNTRAAEVHSGELRSTNNILLQERSNLSALQSTIAGGQKIQDLKKQGSVQPFVRMLKEERDARKRQIKETDGKLLFSNQQIIGLQTTLARSNETIGLLQKELIELKLRSEELKLDLEYAKCTTTSPPSTSSIHTSGVSTVSQDEPLPEAPFVLVLVDGDAYQFASFLPSQYSNPDVHPATRMAHNIRTSLQTYILQNNLPPHCKLMVRVLANGRGLKSGKAMGYGTRSDRVVAAIEDFMVRFTEASPLFEFVDAGVGKERVDGKIHELYHTFLPNPHCHKIFLACARDNGFARMVEPYIDHPTSRAKTCLINAGDIAQEIARLKLETIEWPSVFAPQSRPPEATGRIARVETRKKRDEARAKKDRAELIKKLGIDGYEELMRRRTNQTLTKELFGGRNVDDLVNKLRDLNRMGLGLRTDSTLKKHLLSEAEGEPSSEDELLWTETGVD